jgi:hypothetical protein
MQSVADQRVVTTGIAAKLTHRAESSIREAIARQVLSASFENGRWMIAPSDLFEWDQKAQRRSHASSRTSWDRSAELLAEYGSLNTDELAELVGVHPGNARKHLAILAKQGRAERLADGQWVPIALEHNGAA